MYQKKKVFHSTYPSRFSLTSPKSESRDGNGRLGGCVRANGTSSWIILIDGARSSPLPPSGGNRINIVYTESWLTDRELRRLFNGNDRESRGPEFKNKNRMKNNCKMYEEYLSFYLEMHFPVVETVALVVAAQESAIHLV